MSSTANVSDNSPPQFTLRQAAIATFWIALTLAMAFQWGLGGIVLASATLGIAAAVYGAYRGRWLWTAGGFAILLMGGCLLLPTTSHPRNVAQKVQCCNNLRRIGLALHQYHDEYGSFPPA